MREEVLLHVKAWRKDQLTCIGTAVAEAVLHCKCAPYQGLGLRVGLGPGQGPKAFPGVPFCEKVVCSAAIVGRRIILSCLLKSSCALGKHVSHDG
jgi:hypothetical protein